MQLHEVQLAQAMVEAASDRGVFLVSGVDKPNAMVMGWCTIGYMWRKQVLMAPVRLTRYTHDLIEQHGEFTVCVPDLENSAQVELLKVCGSKSGRDMDKLQGIPMRKGRNVDVPVIDGCTLYLECRVVEKTEMDEKTLDAAILERNYTKHDAGNFHSLYFAEILACYTE